MIAALLLLANAKLHCLRHRLRVPSLELKLLAPLFWPLAALLGGARLRLQHLDFVLARITHFPNSSSFSNS